MVNHLVLFRHIVDEMVNHCQTDFPYEACGFLIGSSTEVRTVNKVKKAKNQATTRNRYIIDPFEYYTVEHSLDTSNYSILGFYHSHPDGSPHPSRFDIKDAWPEYSYLIIALTQTKEVTIKSWQIDSKTGECQEEPIRVLES